MAKKKVVRLCILGYDCFAEVDGKGQTIQEILTSDVVRGVERCVLGLRSHSLDDVVKPDDFVEVYLKG